MEIIIIFNFFNFYISLTVTFGNTLTLNIKKICIKNRVITSCTQNYTVKIKNAISTLSDHIFRRIWYIPLTQRVVI